MLSSIINCTSVITAELISAPFNAVCISELCVQGKVVIEAKKEEKLEIPDEVTIENKVHDNSKLLCMQ
jgi:hypothetical protein